MKTYLVSILLGIAAAGATEMEGILPGEPDPNTSPKRDRVVLIDDTKCPKGKKPFPKMRCGMPDEEFECEHPRAVIECRKRKRDIRCKKPKIPVFVVKCDE